MDKYYLEHTFNAYCDGKLDFNDFLNVELRKNIEEIKVEKREVVKCSEKLKRIHSFFNQFIFDNLEIQEDCVFSYRKNVNVLDCIAPHSKNKFIFKTDIHSFFHSISKKTIYNCIFTQIDNQPLSDIESHLDRICNLVTYKDRLPQGFSTSPVLSNAVFNKFDIKIKKYCNKNNMIYSRYADDLLISSNNYLDKEECIHDIDKILNSCFEQKFKINTLKTKLIKKGKNMEVMGVQIHPDGSLSIGKRLKNEIETKLYLFLKNQNDFVSYSSLDKNHAIARLSGQLNYINTIDPKYIDKLKYKYGNSLVDLFFRKAI